MGCRHSVLQVKNKNKPHTCVARRPDREILIVCCIEQYIDLSQNLFLPLIGNLIPSSPLLYEHMTLLDL